jgi:hypothetical protein
LSIRASDKSLLVYLDATFDMQSRLSLLERLKAFTQPLFTFKETDAAKLGNQYSFEALHFDIYNRSGEPGHGAPTSCHPFYLAKAGGHRVNYKQMLPYDAREKTSLSGLFGDTLDAFDGLFCHIQRSVSVALFLF